MKKLLTLILSLFALAACDEKEIGPNLYYYNADVRILDADGVNVIADYSDGDEIWDCSIRYDEATFGKDLHWHVMKENDSASIDAAAWEPIPLVDHAAELSLQSSTLFADDTAHTLRLVYEKRHKYLYIATALTFDGRAIEPDADGIFVIRLNEK